MVYILYSAKSWRGKTLANQSFQSFGRGNVGEFTIANIATLVNLEFDGVKYWRMVFGSPNSPKFSPTKILHYTVRALLLMYSTCSASAKLFNYRDSSWSINIVTVATT